MTNEAVEERRRSRRRRRAGARSARATCRPPVLAPTVVSRPAAVDRLVSAAPGSIVAVTAPAGYGKSILAAQWDLADRRPFAWVSLDALDDDRRPPRRPHRHRARRPGPPRHRGRPLPLEPGALPPARAGAGAARDPRPQPPLRPGPRRRPPPPRPPVPGGPRLHRRGRPRRRGGGAAQPHDPHGRAREATPQPIRSSSSGPTTSPSRVDDAGRVFSGLGVAIPADRLAEVVERCEGWAGGIHLAALAVRDRDGDPARHHRPQPAGRRLPGRGGPERPRRRHRPVPRGGVDPRAHERRAPRRRPRAHRLRAPAGGGGGHRQPLPDRPRRRTGVVPVPPPLRRAADLPARPARPRSD